jgi:methylglyoxal synthase
MFTTRSRNAREAVENDAYRGCVGTVHLIRTASDPRSFPVIAVVAHEAKLDELIAMSRAQRRLFSRVRFVADVTTARRLGAELGAAVTLAGGSMNQGLFKIGMSIAEGTVDAAIVLRAPAGGAHDPDVEFLLRLCDRHSVPLATNHATATIVLETLAKPAVSGLSPQSRWSRNGHPSVFSRRRFPWDSDAGRILPSGGRAPAPVTRMPAHDGDDC